jgi:hypothetical protein
MPRIPLLVTALILFVSLPALAQWIEYENRTDFFTVSLPGEPRVREITYRSEYSQMLPGRVYSVENGSNRYSITVVDYTNLQRLEADRVKACRAAGGDGDLCNDHSMADLRGALIFATWNFLQRDAKVTHYVYTNADRVEGQELHLLNSDKSRTFASIYMHENRLYIIEGTVSAASPPPLVFQQSMGFLDKDGKRIRYDTPYSNGFTPPKRVR